MLKAIHYINQFFGQVGGEDAADAKPIFHDDLVGCSMMLNQMVKPDIEVTNTIVCGDNYITNHTDEALKEIFAWLDTKKFDIFFAGPAFMAGRYGVGCGIMCKAVAERYHVPVITSMNEENPGVEEYKSVCYIFKGGRKATFMKDDVTAMAKFAKKIAKVIRGSSGGFRSCKAMGFMLEDRGIAQVSMNMVNYEDTPLYVTYEMIKALAERYGTRVIESEIVGLTPAKALIDCAEFYLKAKDFDCKKQVMEYHLIDME